MNKPSLAQVEYVKRLRAQQKLEPMADEALFALTSAQIGEMISELLNSRGKAVWYGNGQFSHWQRR